MSPMDFGDITIVGVSFGVVITFIIFIVIDFVNAMRKKAYWIPGEYLVLSTLTIQLLSLVTGQSRLIKDDLEVNSSIVEIDLWMIHSSRVMLCVMVAYLLPGLARRRSENSWVKVLALVIAIFINMTSELYRVRGAYWPLRRDRYKRMFVLSATINSISFTWLILLLGCAYIASRGIDVTIAQRRPLLLSSTPPSSESKWQSVEDQVLRCWVFARAYSLEFIIARSALTSLATAVVALQILTTLVAWLYLEIDHKLLLNRPIDVLKLVVTGLQCFFILMGCIALGFRWATPILYYKRWQSDTWSSVLRVEDFWTRHIKDMLERKQQLQPVKKLNERIRNLSYQDPLNIPVPASLLYLVLGLQLLTVFVSKTCWVISLILFQNKFMGKLWNSIFSRYDKMVFSRYPEYEKYFQGLGMLQETPESLWIPNRHSIKLARELVRQGSHDARYNCERLIMFLQGKTSEGSGVRCLDLYTDSKKHNNELQLKYLCKLDPTPLEVEEHFEEANKFSWKMAAVSLISIMVHLSPLYVQIEQNCSTPHDFPPEAVKISMDAYFQALEIIDLVEKMKQDDDNDGIMSQAADKLFSQLQDQAQKGTLIAKDFRHENRECLRAAIEDLARNSRAKTELRNGHIVWAIFDRLGVAAHKEKNARNSEKGESGLPVTSAVSVERTRDKTEDSGTDSMDWKTVAAGIAVHKLCKSIDLTSVETPDDITTLLKEIQSSLADIIYACLDEVLNNAVKWSMKCARQSDEKQIARALYTVGKAKKISKLLDAKQLEAQQEKEKPTHLFGGQDDFLEMI